MPSAPLAPISASFNLSTAPRIGTVAFDIEHDDDLDLLVANGRVHRDDPHPGADAPPPWDLFVEPNLALSGLGALLLQTKGLFRLDTEAEEFFVVGFFLGHPGNGFVIPPASLVRVVQLPM